MVTLITPATTGTGVAALRYASLLGEQLGTWAPFTVTEQSTVGQASRIVLASELRDDEADYLPFGEGDVWVYQASASGGLGTQRRLLSGDRGYEGPIGALLTSRPWASALPVGAQLIVTSPLPVKEHLGVKGLYDLTNEALHRSLVEAVLTLSPDGTRVLDLGGISWLREQAQIKGIRDRRYTGTTDPTERAIYPAEYRANGASASLVTDLAYGTTDTVELVVLVDGDRLVYDATAWAYTDTPGLAGDAWQAAVPEDWVVAIGMVKGLQELRKMVRKDRRKSNEEKAQALADIEREMRVWGPAARSIMLDQMPRPEPTAGRPVTGIRSATTDVIERIGTPPWGWV